MPGVYNVRACPSFPARHRRVVRARVFTFATCNHVVELRTPSPGGVHADVLLPGSPGDPSGMLFCFVLLLCGSKWRNIGFGVFHLFMFALGDASRFPPAMVGLCSFAFHRVWSTPILGNIEPRWGTAVRFRRSSAELECTLTYHRMLSSVRVTKATGQGGLGARGHPYHLNRPLLRN